MHRKHQRKSRGERHGCDKHVLRPVMRHFSDFFEVLGHVSYDLTSMRVVEIPERQLLQMIKCFGPHVGLDADP